MNGRHTLGLNMIVGPGEGPELERCLEGLEAKTIFDEVVVGRTTHDEIVKQVCDRYGVDSFYHEWRTDRYPYGNFAAARNAVLDRSSADYIWWADADDSFIGDADDTIKRVQEVVTKKVAGRDVDVWFMSYDIRVDENLRTIMSVWRDRIFKRCKKFRWRHPVHELVGDNWHRKTKGNLHGARMIHLPTKPFFSSAYRNVKILEHEVANGDRTSRTKFFLARDMMMVGRMEEGIELLDKDITELRSKPEDLYAEAMELAIYYAHGEPLIRPSVEQLRIENAGQIERYLRLALTFSSEGAEPYVILGDLYVRQRKFNAAKRCYACALEKKPNTGLLQMVPYYDEIPSWRLADYYVAVGQLESALVFNRRALNKNDAPVLRQQRRAVLKALCREEGIKWEQAPA